MFTPQRVMLREIPPSIHGTVRKAASDDIPNNSLRLVLFFYSAITIGVATLLHWVRCEIVECPRKWFQSWIFVGMLGGNRQEMLGGNNFHSASSIYPIHWKLTYSSTSLTVGSNSSLREFHPVSLSEVWCWGCRCGEEATTGRAEHYQEMGVYLHRDLFPLLTVHSE